MKLAFGSLLLIFLLAAGAILRGQNAVTNAPVKKARSTFPYKKDDRLVARFTWSDDQPVTKLSTVYQVRDFMVESFNPGTPNLVGEAPQCQLNLATTSVSSPGPLKVSQVGGLFSLTGEGFEWNHESGRLVLSNRVRTVVRLNLVGQRSLPSLSP